MLKIFGKTTTNVVKNSFSGGFHLGVAIKNFIGDSIETAQLEALQDEMKDFEEQLAFLPEDERAEVIEMAKQKKLEKMAEKNSSMVVKKLQLESKNNKKGGALGLTPEQLEVLMKMAEQSNKQ